MSEEKFDQHEYWREYQAKRRAEVRAGKKKEVKVQIDPDFHNRLKILKTEKGFATLAETVEWMIGQCAGDI
jgi:hypothetical protein